MKVILAALIALVSVVALQQVTVTQGATVGFQTTVPYTGTLYDTQATYTIENQNFIYQVGNSNNPPSIITTPLTFNFAPGQYMLDITVYANHVLVRQDQVAITVVSKSTQLPVAQQTSTNQPTRTVVLPVLQALITIPAIPDVTAGETLIVPVTVQGSGVFTFQVPQLDFATYEAPASVSVNGERTVPVLVHISKDTKPGLYVLPVFVGADSASARIRVISYEQRANYTGLIIAGILLVLIGLVIMLVQTRKPKEKTGKPKEDAELITYY